MTVHDHRNPQPRDAVEIAVDGDHAVAGDAPLKPRARLGAEAWRRFRRHKLALSGAIILAVIVAVLAICFVVFALAARIAKWLGVTANVVASRLLGVLLAALAVQYVIDGVRNALAG